MKLTNVELVQFQPESLICIFKTRVGEIENTTSLSLVAVRLGGSSPPRGTIFILILAQSFMFPLPNREIAQT